MTYPFLAQQHINHHNLLYHNETSSLRIYRVQGSLHSAINKAKPAGTPHIDTMVRALLVLVVLTVVLGPGQAKVYGRCELAKRLRQLGASESQLATWVCIAHSESGYNTAALNINKNKSKDFGIFQINNRFWCDRVSITRKANCHCSETYRGQNNVYVGILR